MGGMIGWWRGDLSVNLMPKAKLSIFQTFSRLPSGKFWWGVLLLLVLIVVVTGVEQSQLLSLKT